MAKLWFKSKRYGWGWYPASWEGWLVVLAYIVIVILNSIRIDGYAQSEIDFTKDFIVQTIALTIILIATSYIKGEPPKWRWGN